MKSTRKLMIPIIISTLTLFACQNNPSVLLSSESNGKEEEFFCVTWKDENGNILEADGGLKKGDTPSYDSDLPTKENDEYYSYQFTGWSPEIKAVTEDTVYTATYSATLISPIPVTTDTDFDGLDDSIDPEPENSTHTGKLQETYLNDYKLCDTTLSMDYRNFVCLDNEEYQPFMADLALKLSMDSYPKYHYIFDNDPFRTSNIKDATAIYKTIGCTDIRELSISQSDNEIDSNDTYDLLIAHHKFTYNDNSYDTVFLSFKGTVHDYEWMSDYDIGSDTDNYYEMTGEHPEWTDKTHVKSFDVILNRARTAINGYLDTYVDQSANKSILITGHSKGGALANMLGTEFEDSDYKAFTYTFASPCVTTKSEEVISSYKTIFNIVNEDDIFSYIIRSEWGFHRYGIDLIKKISDYGDEYTTLTGDDYTRTNTEEIYGAMDILGTDMETLYDFQYIDDFLFINHDYESEEERQTYIDYYQTTANRFYAKNYLSFITSEEDGKYHLKGYFCLAFVIMHYAYSMSFADSDSRIMLTFDGILTQKYAIIEGALIREAKGITTDHGAPSYMLVLELLKEENQE